MDQYFSDILINIFMHFSLTSSPVHMKVSSCRSSNFARILELSKVLQSSRSHWFFEPWNVLVSLRPHLILEPLKLLALTSWILGSPTLGLPILES